MRCWEMVDAVDVLEAFEAIFSSSMSLAMASAAGRSGGRAGLNHTGGLPRRGASLSIAFRGSGLSGRAVGAGERPTNHRGLPIRPIALRLQFCDHSRIPKSEMKM